MTAGVMGAAYALATATKCCRAVRRLFDRFGQRRSIRSPSPVVQIVDHAERRAFAARGVRARFRAFVLCPVIHGHDAVLTVSRRACAHQALRALHCSTAPDRGGDLLNSDMAAQIKIGRDSRAMLDPILAAHQPSMHPVSPSRLFLTLTTARSGGPRTINLPCGITQRWCIARSLRSSRSASGRC